MFVHILCAIEAILKPRRTPASQVADGDIYDAAERIHIGIAEVIPNFPQMTPSDYRWGCGIRGWGQLATRWSDRPPDSRLGGQFVVAPTVESSAI